MSDISLMELSRLLKARKKAPHADVIDLRGALEAGAAKIRIDPRVSVRSVRLGALDAEALEPNGADAETMVLYLHGGAFVGGSCSTHRALASALALASCRTTVTVNYRLAPEHPWPAAEQDILVAYKQLLAIAKDVVVIGDSAGGNLAMRLLLSARCEGLRMPGAAVLLSPWIDLDLNSESVTRLADTDPTLDAARLRTYAGLYTAGLSGPRILGEQFERFPRMLIQAGAADLLCGDAERLYEELRRAKVPVKLEMWPNAFHVWHAYFPWLSEARQAVHRIGQFLKIDGGSNVSSYSTSF